MIKTWRFPLSVAAAALCSVATSTPAGPLVGKDEWTPVATSAKARQLELRNLENRQQDYIPHYLQQQQHIHVPAQQSRSQPRLDITGEDNLLEGQIITEETEVPSMPQIMPYTSNHQYEVRDSYVIARQAPNSGPQHYEQPQLLHEPRRAQAPSNPPRGPPRSRPRPRPRPRPGILGGLSNLGNNIKCKAEDIAADSKLKDRAYMQRQINCVLDRGPCDKTGNTIKRKILTIAH